MTSSRIEIAGTYNFRDLGGFVTRGGTTRSGVLFRSDSLHRLAEPGLERFIGLGVTRVIDLRDDRERAMAPDALPDTTALVPHPIFPSAEAHIKRQLDIFSLTELIYSEHGDTLARAIDMIADPEQGAVVFHCTAGKDRTGAVAALALLAVGVERDDVLHDYAQSEANLSEEWLPVHLETLRSYGLEVTPIIAQLVGGTPIEAIDRALTGIEQRHGSARDYLLAHGLDAAALDRLHARLLG